MKIRGYKRNEIYHNVISILEQGAHNRFQIKAQIENKFHIKISWEAVNSALDTLESIDYVKKEIKSGRDTYSLNQTIKTNEKTILGLPITEQQEALCCGLANRFKELDRNINNTFLQKMLVNVIEKKDLDIPYGWYLFGPCCVLKLTPECLCKYPSTTDYDEEIKETLAEFSKYPNTDSLMEAIYTKNNNTLYINKLSIYKLLSVPLKDKTSLSLLNFAIKQLLWSIPQEKDSEAIIKYTEIFYSLFSRLAKLSEDKFEDARMDIFACFKSLWELIGTYQMYKTTKQFYENYDTTIHYHLAYLQLSAILDASLFELSSSCPPLEISPEMKALRDSLAMKSQ
jgi:hypothetical protein